MSKSGSLLPSTSTTAINGTDHTYVYVFCTCFLLLPLLACMFLIQHPKNNVMYVSSSTTAPDFRFEWHCILHSWKMNEALTLSGGGLIRILDDRGGICHYRMNSSIGFFYIHFSIIGEPMMRKMYLVFGLINDHHNSHESLKLPPSHDQNKEAHSECKKISHLEMLL